MGYVECPNCHKNLSDQLDITSCPECSHSIDTSMLIELEQKQEFFKLRIQKEEEEFKRQRQREEEDEEQIQKEQKWYKETGKRILEQQRIDFENRIQREEEEFKRQKQREKERKKEIRRQREEAERKRQAKMQREREIEQKRQEEATRKGCLTFGAIGAIVGFILLLVNFPGFRLVVGIIVAIIVFSLFAMCGS